MSTQKKTTILNFDEMFDTLDKRYPNDALRIDELKTDKEKTEYIAKLKLIRELRFMTGRK